MANPNSGEDQFVAGLTTAFGSLRSGSKGLALVSDLMNTRNNVQIVQARKNQGNSEDTKDAYIIRSPSSTLGGLDQNEGEFYTFVYWSRS